MATTHPTRTPSTRTAAPGSHGTGPATAATAVSSGLLVLRVATGLLLAVHGVQGFQDAAGRIATTAQLGAPDPALLGWSSMLGQAGLGLLIAAGLLTRVAGVLAAVLMLSIWAVAHAPHGLLVHNQGVNGENALMFAVVGVALALTGAGRFSLDRLARRVLARRR